MSAAAAVPPAEPGAASTPQPAKLFVGVLLFPGFEPLDFVGPINLFGAVGKRPGADAELEMLYIAEAAGPVTSVTGNLTVVASHSFADLPPPSGGGGEAAAGGGDATEAAGGGGAPPARPRAPLDWLLVPGGVGTRREVSNPALLSFLSGWCAPAAGLAVVMSVCTGAALLAAAGALDGRRATTNKIAFDWVASVAPGAGVAWQRRARWVRDGRVVTSSGVSAGADMAVAVIKAELGPAAAGWAAKYNEYTPATEAGEDPFADEAYVPDV
ncbi:MAG: class I glutamine amidotransferase-like protein [Monoraphidium minutum]|nr:MAG: class I glutamine amidotransferase-like protein [Monoraphidium minutum]